MKLKLLAGLGALSLAAIGSPAPVHAAGGLWGTLPVIGGNPYCGAYVTGTTPGGITGAGAGTIGTICAQTIPAGPTTFIGTELVPVDIANNSILGGESQPQQTAYVQVGQFFLPAQGNRIIGGDFALNLWQRGTTPLSSATPSTAAIGADRWYAYSSGNTVTVSKQTGTADTIPSQGLYASMRVNRPSGTNTTAICTGQVLDQKAAQELIGTNGVFSFWALAGSAFSAANSNITVTVAYYTAADSATPLANTATFATGSITGYQAAIGGVSPGTTGTVASGVATIPISTTWTRYSVWAPIPATNASGTAVNGVGVSVCYTPVGTGTANDYFEIEGAQLQGLSSTAGAATPNGVISPTAFERRFPALEAALQYSYNSPGGLGPELANNVYQAGNCSASGTVNFPVTFNPPLRTAPTAATSVLTAGGYQIRTAATNTAIGTLTIPAATVSNATLTSNAACTTTLPYNIWGTLATGNILFVAEP